MVTVALPGTGIRPSLRQRPRIERPRITGGQVEALGVCDDGQTPDPQGCFAASTNPPFRRPLTEPPPCPAIVSTSGPDHHAAPHRRCMRLVTEHRLVRTRACISDHPARRGHRNTSPIIAGSMTFPHRVPDEVDPRRTTSSVPYFRRFHSLEPASRDARRTTRSRFHASLGGGPSVIFHRILW
jgi:hypothetical protein